MTISTFIHTYLWDLVDTKNSGHLVHIFYGVPTNDSHHILFLVTLVIKYMFLCCEQQIQDALIGHSCIKHVVIDVDSQGEIGQEMCILIDFLRGKNQREGMLVIFK